MRREGAMGAGRSDIQRASMLFGIVFLLVALLGFIPGITQEYDRLTTFDDVGAELLGIFGVNILENIVHLLYGIAGLAAAASYAASKNYFLWGGVLYLVIWIYGLVIDLDSSANFIGVNNAANWLHFVLGVTLIAVGFLVGRRGLEERRAAA
jgi:hypothetical protein